jgi:predicted GIY-YIG superfamily endonuclease
MSKPGELQERLVESEKLMKEMSKTWEEKLIETEKIHQVCERALIGWAYVWHNLMG